MVGLDPDDVPDDDEAEPWGLSSDATGVPPIPGEVLFHDAVDVYLEDRLERGRRRHSYHYLRLWRKEFEGRRMNEIAPGEISDALARWRAERGWSAATRNVALAQLSGLLTFAYRRDPPWVYWHPIRDVNLESTPLLETRSDQIEHAMEAELERDA